MLLHAMPRTPLPDVGTPMSLVVVGLLGVVVLAAGTVLLWWSRR